MMKSVFANQSGQSTIEFIFSFSTAFFLIIYTTKIAMNYTTGYLAHYATYMASRAYLTFETQGNPDAIAAIPQTVFQEVRVDLFDNSLVADGANPSISVDPTTNSQLAVLSGLRYDWQTSFSITGLFGGNQTLEMRSESFLGREPDRATCLMQTCAAASNASGGATCSKDAFTLGDNGC